MAKGKKNNYLSENPTQSFSMRFSVKHAPELVRLINEKAEKENRSFPGMIEQCLIKHFKLNKKIELPQSNGAIATKSNRK